MVTKLERMKSQLNAAKEAYKLESEERVNMQERIRELEVERQKLIVDRDEIIDDARKDSAAYRQEIYALEKKNDDLAIANADYEMQLKQLRESANDAHEEAVQTSRQLHEAKQWRQQAEQDFRDMQDIHNRARLLLRYYLYVELGREGEREDQRQCSQVQRFVYMMQDTLDGK